MGRLVHEALKVVLLAALLGAAAASQLETLESLCQTNNSVVAAATDCIQARSTNVYAPYELAFEIAAGASPFDLNIFVRGLGHSSLNLQLWYGGEVIDESAGDLPEAQVFLSRYGMRAGTYTLRVTTRSLFAMYDLGVTSITDRVSLAQADRTALTEFHAACCLGPNPLGPGPFSSLVCENISTWLTAKPFSDQDFCHQAPNACNDQGQMRKAFLRAEKDGQLAFTCRQPPAGVFAKFPVLDTLDMSQQNLRWSLMDLAAALNGSRVQRLFVQDTQIMGPLAPGMCELVKGTPSLRVLWAGGNQLGGDIPDCMVAHNFTQLRLNRNQINGIIPDKFPPTSPLQVLDLQQQTTRFLPLGGPIPPSLARLANLTVLNLANNDFGGQIPDLPLSLQELLLSSNRFSGSLPASLGQMSRLTLLHLGLGRPDANGNLITGPLPAGFEKLPALVFAYLANNSLTGNLDRDWNMPNLQRLSISMNQLTGTIPAKLASGLPQLRFLRVGTNRLTGTLDEFAAALSPQNVLVGLNVTHNQLSGGMPEGLRRLAVFSNNTFAVTGEFDSNGAPIVFNNTLVMTRNNFSGPYPVWVAEAVASLPDVTVQLTDSTGETNRWACPPPGTVVPAATLAKVADVRTSFLCWNGNGAVDLSSLLSVAGTPPGSSGSGSSGSGSTSSYTYNFGAYPTSRSSASSSPPSDKQGMGAGAIAGIVITVVVLLAAAGLLTFYLLKRRQLQAKSFTAYNGPDSGTVKPAAMTELQPQV